MKAHALVGVSFERGALPWGILKFLLGLVVVMACVLAVGFYLFGILVGPGYFGVRNISFGPGKGYSIAGLKPGVHWDVPYYSKIYFVPSKVQVLNFHRGSAEGESVGEPLKIPTGVDSTAVEVDLTVLYSFFSAPGKQEGAEHGGPADLLRSFGVESQGWQSRVRFECDRVLKYHLRKLSASDFYNPKLRQEKVAEAEKELRSVLAPFGVRVDAVLLRRYSYQNESLEEKIFEKNLEAQERRVQEEQTKLAEVEAELRDVESKGHAAVETLRKKADADANLILSEAERIETEQRASGDLLVTKARAEVDRLRVGLLQNTDGADAYLARQLVPILSSLKGGLVAQSDPYDLAAWMKRLGIEAGRLDAARSERGLIMERGR